MEGFEGSLTVSWLARPPQVKPRRDPWQQKVAVYLQEKQPLDELLKMHSRFLKVSAGLAPSRGNSDASRSSATLPLLTGP